jgi:glycosyltransferase involved in cell wall biosynthesis
MPVVRQKHHRYIFWQNIVSPHQVALLEAMAHSGDIEVVLVADAAMSSDRTTGGWTAPVLHDMKTIISPTRAAICDLVRGSAGDCVHIVTGFSRGCRVGYLALEELRRSKPAGCLVGVQAEPGDGRGLKGHLRWCRWRYDTWRYAKTVDFVLAIGANGPPQFLSLGIDSRRIYPFGYFLEQPQVHAESMQGLTQGMHLVFSAQRFRRKGVDVLFAALATLHDEPWTLQVVGDGPERTSLESLAAALGIRDRVTFRGVMKRLDALSVIAAADLLVLPSRWDGWGAVVSEALMCGVPVICTDTCGASILLDDPVLGSVVPEGDSSALADALRERLRHGPLSQEDKKRIRDWSVSISGLSAAQYLLNVISSIDGATTPPQAPWLIRRPLSAPMTVGPHGPRSEDELRKEPGVTRGGHS